MIFHSIRWRLQLWHSLLLVLVLAGFGFSAYHVARDNQLRRIDQELDQDLMSMLRPDRLGLHSGFRPGPGAGREPGPGQRPFEPGLPELDQPAPAPDGPGRLPDSEPPPGMPGRRPFDHRGDFQRQSADFLARVQQAITKLVTAENAPTNGVYYALWQPDGMLLAQSPGAPAPIPAPENTELAEPPPPAASPVGEPGAGRFGPLQPRLVRTRGSFREVYHLFPSGAVVLAGRSMAADLASMHRLALGLVVAGAGVLLLGLAGGWWLATRAIRPIEAISATAQKIAAGDLSQRIGAGDTDDELGRLAAVLNSTFARLEAAFAQQAQFTADASHELRTPISVILTQTQSALNRERSAAEYRETLLACQRAAQRMRRLIESLLELARWDAGQQTLQRSPCKLDTAAANALELVRPLAEERGIQLQAELGQAEFLGDAERIGQVVSNLLVNAVIHNSTRGQVRLSTGAENGFALLTVADQGPGIAAEHLPHIFERFYRADASRAASTGGTGLGLAIAKAIVEAHGGEIQVESSPGTGTTVRVRLPAAS